MVCKGIMRAVSILFCVEVKVTAGVVVTDILHQLTRPANVTGQITLFHVCAQEVAEDAPEIFMPRKR